MEWVKGSILTEYQSRLAPELYERFLDDLPRAPPPRLADERPYFFTFRRVLMHAAR